MRLFWAVEVPDDIRAAVDFAVVPLRSRWPDLRWTDPAGWHVTVAFLGSVGEELVDDLSAAVRRSVTTIPPVEVRLQAHAATPGGRAGVVWIPVGACHGMKALAAAVQTASRSVVEMDDRPFRGHLTLARVPRQQQGGAGRVARAVAAGYDGPAVSWTVSSIVLMRSETRPDGAVYDEVARVPLAEGGGLR